MGRLGTSAVRNLRPIARGPLQYGTREVRHLLALHHRSLNMTPTYAGGAPSLNRPTSLGGRLSNLGHAIDEVQNNLKAFARDDITRGGGTIQGTLDPADAPRLNPTVEELAVELLRYRAAIELSGDPLTRGQNNIELGKVLDEQEARAQQLAAAGVLPPFFVIVKASTARAAGIRVATLRPICDRGMSWRVWESAAWSTTALLANQAACAREENLTNTRMRVHDLWLVRFGGDLQRLSRYLLR